MAADTSPPRNGEVAAQPAEGPVATRPVLAASGRTIRRARALRKEMTLPEIYLWQRLRGRKGEERWRKQHPCGDHYVLDFFNPGARLCVEVDGLAHDMGDRPARDARRDRWLRGQGIAVLRVAAVDVLRDPNSAAEGVLAHAASRRAAPRLALLGGSGAANCPGHVADRPYAPSDPLRGPPPRSGEDRL